MSPRPGLVSLLLGALVVLACGPRITVEAVTDTPRAPARPGASPGDEGSPDGGPSADEAELEALVEAYAAALEARDPKAASALVHPDTFLFYDDLRRAALYSKAEHLEAWDLMTLIMIFELRARMTREALEGLDGRGLFEAAVEEGLAGESLDELLTTPGLEFEVFEVFEDQGARARLHLAGETALLLRRQDQDPSQGPSPWRVDLPGLMAALAPTVEGLAAARIEAEGKLRTALFFVELRLEIAVEPSILDGPMH